MTTEELQQKIDLAAEALSSNVFAKASLLAKEALAELPAEGTEETRLQRANALRLAGAAAWQQSDNEAALGYITEALAIATDEGDRKGEMAALGLMANVLLRFSDYEKAIEYYTKALNNAYEINDTQIIAKTLGNMGTTFHAMEKITEALEYLEKALELSQRINDDNGVATALGNIGLCYEDKAEYAMAMEYHARALNMHERMGDIRSIAISMNNLGNVYRNIGDYPQALEYQAQALTYYEEIGYKQGVAFCLTNIGNVYELLGESQSALENFTKALEITKATGQKMALAQITCNIGSLYKNLEEYDIALDYYRQSLSLSVEIGSQYGVALNTSNIAGVYGAQKRYDEAFEEFTKALALAEPAGNQEEISRSQFNIGKLYATPEFSRHDDDRAEEIILDVLRVVLELGHKEMQCACYELLAEIYERLEMWQEAHAYIKQFYKLSEAIRGEEIKQQAKKVAFERQIAVMQREQEVTDRLLHKFLPSPIIPEVKAKEGQMLVEHYDAVSILFADLVGFTKLSMKISPVLMVEMLNLVFTHFDTIIKKHGGHRLRTMGDGYFAIMGAPDRHTDHAQRLANAALEMQEGLVLPERITRNLPPDTVIQVRIGLNSGEAVCGLVGGLEKWQYDAYGDTVNTASRMESHGVPGKIHCTEEFAKAAGESVFHFVERGEMEIKGKGIMMTYFVEKRN